MTESKAAEAIPQVVIIDDDRRAGQNASHFLAEAGGDRGIEFVVVSPDDVGDEQDLLRLVDTLPASAVLIDQRLGETSDAPYTGLELADTLRTDRPMLPIFILTKFARDDRLEERGSAVDDIMDKSVLRAHAATYLGRLLRAIGRYEEARSAQSKRMYELVVTSLQRELTEGEADELVRLRVGTGMSGLGREIELSHETQLRLTSKEAILDALEKLIRGR